MLDIREIMFTFVMSVREIDAGNGAAEDNKKHNKL
jgi:hypothetical protein